QLPMCGQTYCCALVRSGSRPSRAAASRPARAPAAASSRSSHSLRVDCGRILTGARGAVMSFKVVATPFGRNVEAAFPHEIEELAVHAMMLLLNLAKKTIPLDRAVREGRWGDARRYMRPMPRVVGDTLGLVAFGNIPRLVARKAKGFDMRVLAWDPFVPDEA